MSQQIASCEPTNFELYECEYESMALQANKLASSKPVSLWTESPQVNNLQVMSGVLRLIQVKSEFSYDLFLWYWLKFNFIEQNIGEYSPSKLEEKN